MQNPLPVMEKMRVEEAGVTKKVNEGAEEVAEEEVETVEDGETDADEGAIAIVVVAAVAVRVLAAGEDAALLRLGVVLAGVADT